MKTPISDATYLQCIERLRELGYVACAWHAETLQDEYNITEAEAIDILRDVLDSADVDEFIFDALYSYCAINGVSTK